MAKVKAIKDRCDTLCRRILRIKHEHLCEYCGKYVEGRESQIHHIRSRKWNNTRWDFCNLVHLCASCHRKYHDGVIGRDWYIEYAPIAWEALQEKIPETTRTWKLDDFKQIEAGLKKELENCHEDM